MKISSNVLLSAVLGVGLVTILNFCSLNEPTEKTPSVHFLQLVNTYDLEIAEPSGLALNPDGNSLWTVSDRTNQVIQIDLKGNVLKTLSYRGNDLEAIAIDTLHHTFWVAEEHTRELVELDSTGKELQRHRILPGNDNSGLEGLCIDSEQRFFTIKEKKPGLFIALNKDFSIRTQEEITFAADFSGLCADTLLNHFWVLSDQDESLFYWDYMRGKITQYKLGVPKPEGIAIDFKKKIAYVVSDSEAKLYVFQLGK